MQSDNLTKLKAIMGLGISLSAVCKVTGYSKAYVSRLLSGDPKCSSPEFYQKLEDGLGRLVDMRTKRLFDLPSVSVEALEGLRGENCEIKKVA